ncbi:MAG: hypothetical protein P8176_13630 [Gammaproteobacteria bacterium]
MRRLFRSGYRLTTKPRLLAALAAKHIGETSETMTEIELAIISSVVGAFIGAALNPFANHFFGNLFKKKGEREYSVNQGLLLLAAANAMWLIGYNFGLAHTNSGALGQVAFYFLSLFLFFGAFGQFEKGVKVKIAELKIHPVGYLILGNLFWLAGEVWEPVEHILKLNQLSYLAGKYTFVTLSILFFSLGLVIWLIQSTKKNQIEDTAANK